MRGHHIHRPQHLWKIGQQIADLPLQFLGPALFGLRQGHCRIPVAFEHEAHVAKQQFDQNVFQRVSLGRRNFGVRGNDFPQVIQVQPVGAHDPHRLYIVLKMDPPDVGQLFRRLLVGASAQQCLEMRGLRRRQPGEFSTGFLIMMEDIGGDGEGQKIGIERLDKRACAFCQDGAILGKERFFWF